MALYGQISSQMRHFLSCSQAMHRDLSILAVPTLAKDFSSRLRGLIAAVGHTWPQRLHPCSHPASLAVILGVHSPESPASNHTGWSVLVRHPFTHSPHRTHRA